MRLVIAVAYVGLREVRVEYLYTRHESTVSTMTAIALVTARSTAKVCIEVPRYDIPLATGSIKYVTDVEVYGEDTNSGWKASQQSQTLKNA